MNASSRVRRDAVQLFEYRLRKWEVWRDYIPPRNLHIMTHPLSNSPTSWHCAALSAARQHPPGQSRRGVRGGVAVATPPRTPLYALAAVALERAKARSSATAATM